MAEDLVDHRRIFDRSADLQIAAAVGAALDVKVEDPLEQSSPAHGRRFFLRRGLSGWGFVEEERERFDYATWRWVPARCETESDANAGAAPGLPSVP